MSEQNSLQAGWKSKFLLETVVFVCGAVVMIFEITGSRLVAPYIGASTYIWTSLIGVILAALSLGYWLGGRMADRRPDVKILSFVIFAAGGLIALTIFFKDAVMFALVRTPVGLELKSVIAAVLLFAPASVLLGFVTPYAVKLKMLSLADAGKTVGRLYALSTVGSIFGTFLAGFVLIPFVGSNRTLYFIAAGLIGLSMLLAPFAFTKFNLGVLIFFAIAVGASEAAFFYLRQARNYYDIDTEYSRLRVYEPETPQNGKKVRVLTFDPHTVQSKMYLDSDELAAEYTKFYHLLRHFKPDFQKTLMIGGAGYSFPKDYLRKYAEAEIDVVEIDPQMTEIAKKFFRLEENPRLRSIHQDGRFFLNQAESGKYDAVLMDAFGSLFSVPFHLTTVEAVREISRVLKNDGVAIFNLGGAIKGESSRFFQAEFNTYRQVFPRLYLFKVNSDTDDRQIQNLIVAACKGECSLEMKSGDEEIQKMLSHHYNADISGDAPILTDDLAPVEYYNAVSQSNQ
jgi:spermidine synthase